MDPRERLDFSAWPPVLIVILLATTSAFLARMTLESERPPPTGQGVPTAGIQSRDARLWQDPFVVAARKSEPPSCYELQAGQATAALTLRPCRTEADGASRRDFAWLRGLIESRRGRVQILYALVPGGTWVGADEYRRRHRYAILAGANRQGYIPEDPEHLGYLEETIDSGLDSSGAWQASEPWEARLPFEWLSHAQSRSEHVLLVWVDEETLGQTVAADSSPVGSFPLTRLTALIERLATPTKGVTTAIIGPYSSTFLHGVAADPNLVSACEKLKEREIQWYSPSATLPDEYLTVPNTEKRLTPILPNFHRMIVSDDELARALATELAGRNVNPEEAIALVGLWDTAYSRRLRELIEQQVKLTFIPGKMPTVITASYLRGVDGRLPQRGQADKGSDTRNGKEAPADRVERPEGDAQIDYLRRLALNLKRRQRDDGKRIAAIGVIGDDYHDKLLALRALRPSFPGAVFFTTDLDAAMLHPADNKVTRNLLVASGYGLSLRKELQEDIPPFRYVYQSAAFLAAQVALGVENQVLLRGGKRFALPTGADRQHCLNRAQLFEIGYTEAVELNSGRSEEKGCDAAGLYLDPHAPSPAPPTWRAALTAPTAVLLAGLLFWGTGFAHRGHLLSWALGVIGAGVLSFTMVFLLRHHPETREPFSLLQGVSIWPGEFLRLLAIAVAVGLFLRGRELLRQNLAAVEEAYPELKAAPDSAQIQQPVDSGDTAPLTQARRIRRWFDLAAPAASVLDVSGLWRIYRRDPSEVVEGGRSLSIGQAELALRASKPADERSSFLARLPFWLAAAAFILTVLLTARGLIAVFAERPNTPTRGSIELWINWAILIGAVLSFLLLLFQAAYESFRAVWLARRIQGQIAWPEATYRRYEPQHDSAGTPSPSRETFDFWLDVDLIARVTEPVQRIVFYPFPVLALLILSRSRLFDGWDIPSFLLILMAFYVALVVAAAWRLRTTAEKLRRRAGQRLTKETVDAKMSGNQPLALRLQSMLDYLRGLATGAFLPFSEQPLVRAALTVLGSYSGITLLEYLRLMNL